MTQQCFKLGWWNCVKEDEIIQVGLCVYLLVIKPADQREVSGVPTAAHTAPQMPPSKDWFWNVLFAGPYTADHDHLFTYVAEHGERKLTCLVGFWVITLEKCYLKGLAMIFAGQENHLSSSEAQK